MFTLYQLCKYQFKCNAQRSFKAIPATSASSQSEWTSMAAEPARKKSKTAVACRKSDHVKNNAGPIVSSGSPPYIELMWRTHTCKDGTYVDYCCKTRSWVPQPNQTCSLTMIHFKSIIF
ncbi:hypothetical protein YC2023_002863 [Brassica napus]